MRRSLGWLGARADTTRRRLLVSVLAAALTIGFFGQVHREVIVLGYSLDLSQAQIAERLEWPIGTVKSRTRRALAQLRTSLAGVTDAEEPLFGASTQRDTVARAETRGFPR